MRQSDEYDLREAWPDELRLDDGAGPALPLSQNRAEAMLQAALDRGGFAQAQVVPLPVRAPRTRRHSWVLAAAAVLLACVGAGSASAAVYWWVTQREQAPEVEAAPAREPRQTKRAHKPAPVVRTQATPDEATRAPEAARPTRATKPRARAPEDWLEEGNRLRAARNWRAADEAYARVWQTAPRSQAAYVARVAAASIRLDHLDDPRGALANYRAALAGRPQGALGEEVLFGLAESYRKLGNSAAEREALARFLKAHPGSALAARATARLEALEAAP